MDIQYQGSKPYDTLKACPLAELLNLIPAYSYDNPQGTKEDEALKITSTLWSLGIKHICMLTEYGDKTLITMSEFKKRYCNRTI